MIKTNVCYHCNKNSIGIAPCIIIAFLFYFKKFLGIPWCFPVTINIHQGISQFGQDQGSRELSEGVNNHKKNRAYEDIYIFFNKRTVRSFKTLFQPRKGSSMNTV